MVTLLTSLACTINVYLYIANDVITNYFSNIKYVRTYVMYASHDNIIRHNSMRRLLAVQFIIPFMRDKTWGIPISVCQRNTSSYNMTAFACIICCAESTNIFVFNWQNLNSGI